MSNDLPDDVSLRPARGWHCSHFFYRFDRVVLGRMSAAQVAAGRSEFRDLFDPAGSDAPIRLQASIVSGHKADFGLMLLDPDPLRIDGCCAIGTLPFKETVTIAGGRFATP